MRLRNIKGATEAIESSPYCIQAPAEMKKSLENFSETTIRFILKWEWAGRF